MAEKFKCNCWCHMNPEPEYDSNRDYFGTHEWICNGKDAPNSHPFGKNTFKIDPYVTISSSL